MNLNENYFKDNFTKEDNNVNLNVNKLEVDCITSNKNNFSLDDKGNLVVKSISTLGPTPDIVSPKGTVYHSIENVNPSEYFGGIWESIKGDFSLLHKKEGINAISQIQGYIHDYNIKGKCEQENEPSLNSPSKIENIKGITNLFDIKSYFENNIVTDCTKKLTDNGIILSFNAGADARIGHAVKKGGILSDEQKKELIKIQPNTTYTLSSSSFPKCYIGYVDKDYNVINEDFIRLPNLFTHSTYTFTTPNDIKYIMFRFGIQNNNYTSWEFNNIQLEEGGYCTFLCSLWKMAKEHNIGEKLIYRRKY